MKPGYYKDELRPCPNCNNKAELIQGRAYCLNENCGCGCMFPDEWNNRPAFDKAIDALMDIWQDTTKCSLGWGMRSYRTHVEKNVTARTGLAWEEALEVYKQRQVDKH
jgi:hypothetical protein